MPVTKANASKYLVFIEALAKGKEVEVKNGILAGWAEIDYFNFSSPPEDYRIKPGPLIKYGVLTPSGAIYGPSDSETTAIEVLRLYSIGSKVIKLVQDLTYEGIEKTA